MACPAPALSQPDSARLGRALEYPPTVARIGPWNVPVAGGGYFRLFPFRFTQHCFRQVNAANQAVMFYLHPWEVDPASPAFRAGPGKTGVTT